MPSLIDLSHTLRTGMPSYPGLPEPRIETVFTHEESATRGTYAPGTTFQIATYEFSNVGTYIDSPFHRHPNGHDLAQMPLEKVANLEGVVVTFLGEGALPLSLIDGLDVRGKAVLVRTDWSRRWGTDSYFRSGPISWGRRLQRTGRGGCGTCRYRLRQY